MKKHHIGSAVLASVLASSIPSIGQATEVSLREAASITAVYKIAFDLSNGKQFCYPRNSTSSVKPLPWLESVNVRSAIDQLTAQFPCNGVSLPPTAITVPALLQLISPPGRRKLNLDALNPEQFKRSLEISLLSNLVEYHQPCPPPSRRQVKGIEAEMEAFFAAVRERGSLSTIDSAEVLGLMEPFMKCKTPQ
jgi:hypothetical protein